MKDYRDSDQLSSTRELFQTGNLDLVDFDALDDDPGQEPGRQSGDPAMDHDPASGGPDRYYDEAGDDFDLDFEDNAGAQSDPGFENTTGFDFIDDLTGRIDTAGADRAYRPDAFPDEDTDAFPDENSSVYPDEEFDAFPEEELDTYPEEELDAYPDEGLDDDYGIEELYDDPDDADNYREDPEEYRTRTAGRRNGRKNDRGRRPAHTADIQHKKRSSGVWFYLIPALLLCVIMVSGFFFLRDFMEYRKAGTEYSALETFIDVDKDAGMMTAPVEPSTEEPAEEEEYDTYPVIDINFDELASINSDFAGVLYIPSIEVNYPVVISHDNAEYLTRTFRGTTNSSGSIFMDCYASRDLSDSNTLIYGHNMKNGTMFGSLKKLDTSAGFDSYAEDPYFYIYTKNAVYKYGIFSFHTTPVDSYIYRGYSSENGYDSYISQSLADFGVTLNQLDRESPVDLDFSSRPDMVTLSTCWGTGHVYNFVVHGLLLQKFTTA